MRTHTSTKAKGHSESCIPLQNVMLKRKHLTCTCNTIDTLIKPKLGHYIPFNSQDDFGDRSTALPFVGVKPTQKCQLVIRCQTCEPTRNTLINLFIYLGFYVAFNTVQVISRRVVGRAEETSTYSSLGFCTVNCQSTASNYQLSHLRPCWGSNPGLRGGRRECYHSATVAPYTHQRSNATVNIRFLYMATLSHR